MSRFPSGSLNKLWITMKGIDLYDWIGTIGFDAAIDFAHYMRSFNNARLETKPEGPYQRRFNHPGSDMSSFFRLLEAFKGNRKVFCDANISQDRPPKFCLDIKNNKNLSSYYGLDDFDIQRHFNNDGTLVNRVGDQQQDERATLAIDMPSPDINNRTPTGLGICNDLHIYHAIANPVNLLNHVLANCLNLSRLVVLCRGDPGFEMGLMSHKSDDDMFDPYAKTADNIKVVELLKDVALDQDMLDLISAQLPNVEGVLCQGKDLQERHLFDIDSTAPKDVTINLKAFKKLKVFNLDLNVLEPNNFKRLFIHFKYTDDNEEYYSAERKRNGDLKKLVQVTVEDYHKAYNDNNDAFGFISLEIDKIEELNLFHDGPYFFFANSNMEAITLHEKSINSYSNNICVTQQKVLYFTYHNTTKDCYKLIIKLNHLLYTYTHTILILSKYCIIIK